MVLDLLFGAVATESFQMNLALGFGMPAWYGLLPRTANLKENLSDQILVVEVRWNWFGEGEFLTYGGRNDSEKVIFILAVENFYNLGFSNCRREARMKVELQLGIEPSQGASILFFTG